ncbi:MAG TPA: hypothetical protein VFW87_25640 [Pirellulales bacterium]|nr:hypothetical protein [Pirellulales bacterium]
MAVADFLSAKHGIAIRLGWAGLEEAGLASARPVTMNVKDICLKSALELVLDEINLTCAAAGDELVIIPKGPGARPLPQRWEIHYSDITLEGYGRHLDEQGIELGLVDSGQVTYVSGFSKSKPEIRKRKVSGEKRLWSRWREGEMKQADVELVRRAGIASGDRPIVQFYPTELERKLLSLERDYRGRKIVAIAKTRFGVRRSRAAFEFYVIDQEEREDRE